MQAKGVIPNSISAPYIVSSMTAHGDIAAAESLLQLVFGGTVIILLCMCVHAEIISGSCMFDCCLVSCRKRDI